MDYFQVLNKCGESIDRITLRKTLAELVRRGLVRRVPDYDRKKMVFRIGRKEVCSQRG